MKYSTLSRRMFLVGGGQMLSIPVLTSLLPSRVEAQLAGTSPLRFVLVGSNYSPNSQCYFGGLKANQTAPGNALMPTVNYQALADVPGDISYILSPFTALKSKISILKHLDVLGLEGGAHPSSFPSVGAGQAGSTTYNNVGQASIDCLLANSSKVYTQPIAANRRHVSVNPNYNGGFVCSYNTNPAWTPGMPEAQKMIRVSPIRETEVLWQRFVSLFKPADGAAATPGASLTETLNPVFNDYERVAQDPRLGAEDRKKLEAYMALISDLQKDMGAGGALGKCIAPLRETETVPPPPPAVGGKKAGEGDNTFLARSQQALVQTDEWRVKARELEDIRVRNQLRIIAAAMACDLTRSVSIGFGFDGQGDLSHSYDHDGGTYNHRFDQNGYALAFNNQHRRIAGHVAFLAKTFDGIKDGTRTLLDNSLIYWAMQYGTITRGGDGHSHVCMPSLIAGNAGGKLNTGYFIDYKRGIARNYTVGLPLNNLFVTFMNAFGLKSSDYETAAGQGYGGYNGPFGTAFPEELKTAAARRMPLPLLYKGSSLG